jgi:hypothetical protein
LVEIELMGKAERNPVFPSPFGGGFLLSQRWKGRRKVFEIPVLNSMIELRL